jgi:RND family efflux transporter MFP subunit
MKFGFSTSRGLGKEYMPHYGFFKYSVMKNAFVGFLFLSLLWGCQSNVSEVVDEEQLVREIESVGVNVNIAKVEKKTFQKQLVANGKIEALEKSDLQFKIGDRLAGILVKNGDWVQYEQQLAFLDNALLQNQVSKARIDLEKAHNKFLEEKINYGLGIDKDTIDDPEVLRNLKIKSGIFEAENALENAQLRLEQTLLKAPFEGVIANLETNVGNVIEASDVFCTIINPNRLEVAFAVLESEYSFVKKGQKVSIQAFNNPEQQFEGVVTEINPFVDENGMIKMKARVHASSKSLFDGLHVKVFLNHPIPDVLVIPKKAVVVRSNREVVFTLENGMAKWNYVDIIDENHSSYAVRNGLSETDTLIISGNLNLSHQAKINTDALVFLEPQN